MALKDKPEVRLALWQAYHMECAICLKGLISRTDLEIDHIIAQAIYKDEEKKKKVMKTFELPKDFDFDGLENLRPTHHACNKDKRAINLTDEITLSALRKAKRMIPSVKKYIKSFEEEFRYARNIEIFKKQLEKEDISGEEFLDHMNNYVADFGVEDSESELIDGKSVLFKNKSVKLEGFLPSVKEHNGSCLFTFNSFYIRGASIQLGHNEILGDLYPGNNSPIDFELRRYIVCKLNEDSYIIQLGNSRFNLTLDEVNNLCDVVDKFIVKYVNEIQEVEKILECQKFIPHYYDSQKYQLLKIDMDLWKKILKFSKKYDFENGESDWHIFDASTGNMLKIYIDGEYKCFIHSFIEDPFEWTPSNRVWLLWDDMSYRIASDYWTVNYAYEWLIGKLLPKVISEDTGSSCLFKRKTIPVAVKTPDYYMNGDVRYLSKETIVNKIELINSVEKIRLSYSINSYFCVNKEDICKLYKAILMSVNECNKLDYHYICSKLQMTQSTNNKEEIINFIDDKIDEYRDLVGEYNGLVKIYDYQLDLLFRVFYVSIRDSNKKLEIDKIQSYLELIDRYIDDYNEKRLVECYSSNS